MVLHDLPTGAMKHLETFLDRVETIGADFNANFPAECVPIIIGKDMLPLGPYVATP